MGHEDAFSDTPAPPESQTIAPADREEASAELQRLDPRSVRLGRSARWTFAGALAFVSLGGLAIGYAAGASRSLVDWSIVGACFLLVFGALGVYAHLGPLWRYRHTTYRLDEHGMEIARGRFWHEVISVPRARVQHTDVSQGPLERRFGLATLIIYTAGTANSAISLAGLAHETAMRLREELLRAETADAV